MSVSKNNTQKRTKIILIVAVAVVWSIIFVKAFKIFGGNDNYVIAESKVKVQQKNYSVEVDSFQLLLSYADPFKKSVRPATKVSKAAQRKKEEEKKAQKKKEEELKKKECIWGEIVYGGIIRNNQDNNNTVLIKLGKRSFFINESDSFKEYNLYKVYSDSVVVRKGDCEKVFYRK